MCVVGRMHQQESYGPALFAFGSRLSEVAVLSSRWLSAVGGGNNLLPSKIKGTSAGARVEIDGGREGLRRNVDENWIVVFFELMLCIFWKERMNRKICYC
ncbi:hypothetical protein Zmor_022885 [Zophobas morio]|uniref:Uncharacterized protein n=1 Tax=Zophobas morio TaxID=2755281 RepID=A0AA38HYJ1_9CUCU|nr:hypothetical protein Zmor_022885 [Zophobas morio]